ncbi:natural resistance-associated macrophage protein [Myxozyma melibiosi]|uniref:Natural resistance-associated macrophage protein n=1 Tax=Myxozyma melibiosi TaxID=54550 RepID=A0ABR1EZA5_9ASCO
MPRKAGASGDLGRPGSMSSSVSVASQSQSSRIWSLPVEYEMDVLDTKTTPKPSKLRSFAPANLPFFTSQSSSNGTAPTDPQQPPSRFMGYLLKIKDVLKTYMRFIGPGFMVAVAYIDPGNYSTDVSAGAQFRFKLLFVVLLANVFAIFLQSLCTKLGCVTGLDLAQNCRAHLPRWLCVILYLLAEAAIIATDIAEVIGTAIALNILFHIPLVAGVAITITDVLIVLMAYKPNGSLKGLRWFEQAVALLVLAVVICFCVELSHIDASVGEVFKGYLPSKTVVSSEGLYAACGILGATVMPHSLYLGSGLIQPRLRDYDATNGNGNYAEIPDDINDLPKYRPSLAAMKHALKYSLVEQAVALFTFALFVNSSILILAGATLSDTPGASDADLFSIYDMLTTNLNKAAGTVFALALLFSGQSAGMVCTLAGQMVSEGFLRWTLRPWLRRLITRGIAIVPCIVVAAAVGRDGLGEVLNLSQVMLSILLPFVTAPLIYFTCRKQFMQVPVMPVADSLQESIEIVDLNGSSSNLPETQTQTQTTTNGEDLAQVTVDMSNGIIFSVLAVAIWLFITGLNIYLIVMLGTGEASVT